MSAARPIPPVVTLRRLYFTLMLRGRIRSGAAGTTRRSRWRWAFLLSLYGFVGLVALNFVDLAPFARAASLHALTMLMIALTMVNACSQLLFNAEEPDVLLHRPIRPRDLLAAKAQVLVFFALSLALAVNVAGTLAGALGPGGTWRFVPAHAASLALEVVFCLGVVTSAYGLCLKWFGRERIDGVLTGAQIIVAVAAMLSGQLVPRLVSTLTLHEGAPAADWKLALLPPAWFGALDSVLSGGKTTTFLQALALLGVSAPLVLAWFAFRRMANVYGEGLVTLQEAGAAASARPHGRRLTRWLGQPPLRWWVRSPVERAAFRLVGAALGRARDVKLRIYPQLVQGAVYPVIFFARDMSGGPHAAMPGSVAFGTALAGAMSATLAMNVLEMLRYADHWRGAEIFLRGPLAHPADLFFGMRKAVLTLLCAPVVLVTALVLVLWRGPQPELALLLPGALLLPAISYLPAVWKPLVPFSEPPEDARGAGAGCLRLLVVFGLAFVVAGAAWAAWRHGWFVWLLAAEIPAVALTCLALRRTARQRHWHAEEWLERL